VAHEQRVRGLDAQLHGRVRGACAQRLLEARHVATLLVAILLGPLGLDAVRVLWPLTLAEHTLNEHVLLHVGHEAHELRGAAEANEVQLVCDCRGLVSEGGRETEGQGDARREAKCTMALESSACGEASCVAMITSRPSMPRFSSSTCA
jgi:hypothetical protein